MNKSRRGGWPKPASAPKTPSDSEQRALDGERLKNEGNNFFVQDDYNEAVDRYKKAVEVNGPQPVYLSNLAAAYLKLKHFDLAEEAATSALAQDPWMIKALYRRGIARKETGQLSAAQADFQAILSKDPDNVNAQTELSDVYTKINGTKPPIAATDAVPRFILHLAIDEMVNTHGDIISRLRSLSTVTTVKIADKAKPLLSSASLVGVIITDTGVSKKQHADLLTQLVAYVKAGGTVVICGAFSSFMSVPDMNAFFKKGWGLPWKMSAYHRTTFVLNQTNPLATATTARALQKSYSMKAVHLTGVAPKAALYVASDESRVESMVFAPTRITNLTDVPVVFAELGRGWLGYVGDVNSEQGSTEAIVAMFRLQTA
ncbi:hypothetical protein C8R46DRAFT_1208719 [Mycena filopes]|nr:hypothetical protein C8R46DRAFT_1208719 [Mycena filopes]